MYCSGYSGRNVSPHSTDASALAEFSGALPELQPSVKRRRMEKLSHSLANT